MKKLMIALAAMVMAVCAQAAQLDWSVTKNSMLDASGTVMSGQTAYLLVFSSSAEADSYYDALAAGTTSLSAAIASAVGNATGSTSSKSKGAITATATGAAIVEGTWYYGAVLTVAGDTFMMSAAVQGQAYNPAGSIETEGTAFAYDSSAFNGAADTRTGWTAVAPEPTSGLLMLVGLGALALRRRRA